MKVLVPVKRVVDHNVKIRVKSDQSGIELDNVKMAMNPFDEIAVEEAVRLKEANQVSEIIAVTIGAAQSVEQLRTALALGVDRAIHIPVDGIVEPLVVAKLLAAIVKQENPDLVVMGKQAIDDDANQTGQMLAALLDWPQATFASKVEKKDDALHVTREIDGGLETLAVTLPAIITTDLRLNTPRYAALPNIMKARQKPIETHAPDALGVAVETRLTSVQVIEPPKRKAGIKVADAAELVKRLKEEAKVL